MADTTPNNNIISNDIHIEALKNEIIKLNSVLENQGKSIHKRQVALVRIYNIFDETMHVCKLKLNSEGRMAWMQEIARIASATTVPIKQAIDEPIEISKVEPIKPAKTVGVGLAGEKSGI